MKGLPAWIGLWVALGGFAGEARAHAVLLATEPAADARLADTPEQVVLRFNEPVVPIDLQILDGAGSALPLPDATTSGEDVIVAWPPSLGAGSYLVSYRVRSTDAHLVSGSFAFVVGKVATGAIPAPADGHDALWRAAGFLTRTLLYASLLMVAGARLLSVVTRVPGEIATAVARPLQSLTWVGLALAIAFLGIAGAGLTGGSSSVLLSPRPWALALATPIGVSFAVAGLGLLLLLWEAGMRSTGVRVAGAGLIALSFALSGHAETSASRWVTVPAISLHALCAAFWVGAFWPLLVTVRRAGTPQAAALIEAFSRYALVAVPALVAAGGVLAILQLSAPDDLIDTAYGQRLGLKLLSVCALLALAALNRLVLTPGLRSAASAQASRALRATLVADLVLAGAVVALTASLSLDPPPRALAARTEGELPPRSDFAVYATAGGLSLVAVVAPAAIGTSQLTLYLIDPDGQPLASPQVDVRWSLPALGIEPLQALAEARADGTYRVDRMTLPAPGRWDLRVDVLIDDFTKVIFRAQLKIDEAPVR